MKVLKNNLSIFAVIAAAVSAFAFNGLDPEPDSKLFANTPSGWVEVSEADVRCNQDLEQTCVARFENNDTSTPPIYTEPGEFIGEIDPE